MPLGLIAIIVCVLCLVGSLFFALPGWINLVGIIAGVVGVYLTSKQKKDRSQGGGDAGPVYMGSSRDSSDAGDGGGGGGD